METRNNIINNKQFFYDINIQSYFYIINNNLNYTNKEHIKREIWEELLEKSKGNEEKIKLYKKEFNKIYNEILLNIPNVIPVFEINKPFGIYKENNIKYFNMFKPTELMEECKKLRENKNKIHDDINFYKKYKYVSILIENLIPNTEERHYFLNWLSYVFNTLKKTRNSIVIKGIQGTGKGVFSQYILEKYFGDYLIYTSNDDLSSKFNSNLMNKLMNIGNELINFEDKRDIREKLKQWITEDYIRIEEKGIKSTLYKNTFNMIIFSNNKNPVNIESTDRRFSIIETNNIKLLDILEQKNINKNDYFKELEKESKEFIKELCLYNYDENKVITILENDEKEDIRLDTEQKTLILKRKLETLDKNFFNNKFYDKFLFDMEIDEYKEILEKIKLGFIEDNDKEDLIEYNHKFIVNETFKQLDEFGGVESKYLFYYLILMYKDKYTLKQLEQKLNDIGKGKRIYITNQDGKKKRVRIREIKILNKKKNNNIKTTEDILKEENEQLKKQLNEKDKILKELERELEEKNKLIKELEKEIENLKNPISLF
jgi:hypothetical protein